MLGIVLRGGAVTSYAIARELAGSPSSRWSGSAGAVYPASKRLEQRGLLEGRVGATGRRRRRRLSITAAGRRLLERWISPPFPAALAKVSEDPLRTRAFFLELLPAKRREAFVASARELVTAELELILRTIEKHRELGEGFAVLALHGLRLELEARLSWLGLVASQLPQLDLRR